MSEPNDFFRGYAKGKYRDSCLLETPDGTILLLGRDHALTERQMKRLLSAIRKRLGVDVVAVSGAAVIESMLMSFLERALPKHLFAYISAISFDNVGGPGAADLDIELVESATLDREMQERYKRTGAVALESLGLRVGSVSVSAERELPLIRLAVLRVVAMYAPIGVEDVRARVVCRVGRDIRMVRVRSILDRLRREGFLSWQAAGVYVLTAKGVQTLPPERNRGSWDVIRALELGRRRW